ncbi:MAG: glycosyltransferase family 39 protein [candidate division KSB1 bacterium]|nr:glycosyltransferase family 39 protein [candidate division KSB1 bacterium]
MKKINAEVWGLVLILIIAAGFRLYHIDFGKPLALHPDEIKLIAQAGRLLDSRFMDKQAFFAIEVYPPFFTYMLAAAVGAYIFFGLLFGRFDSLAAAKAAYFAQPFQFFLVGRLLSVLLGTALVVLTYLIAKRLFSKTAAFAAAILAAVNMALVNHAHFSTVDTAAAFWGLLFIHFCVRILQDGRRRDYLLAAASLAVAVATKFSLAVWAVLLPAAHFMRFPLRELPRKLLSLDLLLAVVVGIIAFAAACPLIWLDFHETWGGIIGGGRFEKIGKIGSGGELFSYWTGRHAPGYGVFYPNAFPESFGMTLTVAAAASLIFLIIRHRRQDILLLLSILTFYLFFELMAVKAIRHLLPIIPLLMVSTATALDALFQQKARTAKAAALAVFIFAFVSNLSRGIKYWQAMGHTDPRLQAREWILEKIPLKSLILVEDYPPPLPDLKEQDNGYRIKSIGITRKTTGLADTINVLLKKEAVFYYVADGFSRQIFAWKETLKQYPTISWDRVQFFDWLDRTGKLIGRFDSRNPRFQPDIFVYELRGKRR